MGFSEENTIQYGFCSYDNEGYSAPFKESIVHMSRVVYPIIVAELPERNIRGLICFEQIIEISPMLYNRCFEIAYCIGTLTSYLSIYVTCVHLSRTSVIEAGQLTTGVKPLVSDGFDMTNYLLFDLIKAGIFGWRQILHTPLRTLLFDTQFDSDTAIIDRRRKVQPV